MIKLISFGYKYGEPLNLQFTYDCRKLRNPHNEPALRPLDGRDPAIQTFVERCEGYNDLYVRAQFDALTSPDATLGFGCYGGRHRSVATVELLAADIRRRGHAVTVEHRELAGVEK